MKPHSIAGVACSAAFLASTLLAHSPTMVTNRSHRLEPASSSPDLYALADGRMVGAVSDEANGRELWITDGTQAGSRLVLDINPGTASSNPFDFTELGGIVYFFALDEVAANGQPQYARKLWRSDGTTAGTWVVRSFPSHALGLGPIVSGLSAVGGSLYFAADDGEHGVELWRSDGSRAGTELVKDLVAGPEGSSLSAPVPFGVKLVFTISRGAPDYPSELWISDGSAAGTEPLRVFTGTPQGFVPLGDLLLFSAVDADHGQELWRTDGTEAGTALVKDIAPGPANASPILLGEAGGAVLFINYNEPQGLWRSDGTEAGTLPLREGLRSGAGLDPGTSAAAAGKLFFSAFDQQHGTELWVSDGTPEGTRLARDIRPGAMYGAGSSSDPFELTALGDRVVFAATESAVGRELWVSDGSETGTVRVRDIRAGFDGSMPAFLVRNGDRVFLAANDGVSGYELWVSDGTGQGTALAANLASEAGSFAAGESVAIASTLYFTGSGLWASDGSDAGTARLSEIPSEELTRVGGRIYFRGYDPVNSYELWTTNGTAEGTRLVRDIAPGAAQSSPHGLTAVGLRLYFRASDTSGLAVWYTDSATGATNKLALPGNVLPGPNLGAAGGVFYLTDYYSGDLWRADGTPKGARNLNAGALNDQTGNLRTAGTRLFFTASDSAHGYEPWRSDGTQAGTGMVADVCPGSCSSITPVHYGNSAPSDFAVAGIDLFFVADDGVHGRELWRTDGIAGGAHLVADLTAGGAHADPVLLGSLGGTLFFTFDDGEHGVEPWVSDGTAAGTHLLADLNPGERGSHPHLLVTAGAAAYFVADTDAAGVEPWRSDGTAAGTEQVADINPGPASSGPYSLAVTDDLLFFNADDGTHGLQLWALPYDPVHLLRQRVGR